MKDKLQRRYTNFVKAYELIADEKNWTRDLLCFDANGKSVDPSSATCVKWNMVGAIKYCYEGDRFMDTVKRVQEHVLKLWGVHSLTYFNSQEWRPHSHIINTLKDCDV
jgi:hypothetical protein